jgi:Outer membrane protein beta-barrel domain
MISLRGQSVARHTVLLCTALVLSLGYARAQNSTAPDSSASAAVSSTESSSNALHLDDAGMPDQAALPAAPKPDGAAGGQYDNRSHGGGGASGIMSHLTYEAGGGFNAPTGDSSDHITWGGQFTVGVGYRLNKMLSAMLEYQFVDNKLPGAIIAEAGATGGHVHIWSLAVDPVVDLTPKSKLDVYVTGGGGFYRAVTSFTDPIPQQYCTYFYGCGTITQNAVVGHYSSNQGGFNIGGGIAHRFGGWNGDGKLKVFAEARYLDVLTPAITTQANGLGTTSVSADTKIIPVSVGVRW